MDTYKPNYSKMLHTEHIFPPATGSSHINVSRPERVLSAVGGAALALVGLRQPGTAGVLSALAGGVLLFRGFTGYCPMNQMLGRDTAENEDISVDIIKTITVERPRTEVYQFWRMLENLPKFMEHLESVRSNGPQRSHWVAKVPGGMGTIAWDADIIQEKENELIAWRSLPNSDIDNAGEVRFSDSPDGRGTIVQAVISYSPPAGSVGGLAAKMLNPMLKSMVEKDLKYFKRFMETGQDIHEPHQPLGAN
ncbi:YgaP-like transmembrane domain [uncultured Pontibacter sp.]|uniref:YgaP-like transmembrane domain n=1 Tax=uncultured Pontibacter sp. TaxID=453356 RepID=UPI00262809F1|nr:YgaP-like transmembrane domain [uncultured Pontibacter sp.]